MPDDTTRLRAALADRYDIQRELGRGGMATVYLAEDLKHGRRVAIKVLTTETAAAIGHDRFRREIEIAARLTHPHILPLHDSGVADGRLFYVMPFIEGETLRARIEREKQLPLEDALRLTREIADALGHAHQRGLVHRDIKPENILLSDGIAVVADFGIARAVREDAGAAMTTAGTVIGTPAYMAPEQLLGSPDIDGRADLYSLGCVLHEMLAGVPPFTGPRESLARQHLSVAPPRVTDARPSVPSDIATAIVKTLAKTPTDRFASAARFAEALATATLDTMAAENQPSAVPSTIPTNLPKERTLFIGREKELEECARLLEGTRLLTLTGVGGAGKTRLAIKVAGRRVERFRDGVWFVDLAPLAEGRHVVEAVAQTLGVREEAGRGLIDTVSAHLRGKRTLLVLDNCEHVLPACADLADALLSACDDLRILATSREGLGIEGERLSAVRSLSVPASDAARDHRAIAASEAVRLFADRARIAHGDFSLDAGNAVAVAEICRRLDGIPLAIELAAARVRMLSVEQIRARLDDRFRLLTGGARSGLARHQTLRATIQWSYDQLTGEEQRLFRMLSVFSGGWTLELAAHVADASADEFAVLDLLGRLVDKSLVIVERGRGSEPRYALLETVRQYGQGLLADVGEATAVRRRHLEAFTALAERAFVERFVREEAWGATLELEHENLRAALEVARERGGESYLELAGALAWFWQARSHALEGRAHLTAALDATSPEPVRPFRARAEWGTAMILGWQGEATAARARMDVALRMLRLVGDRREIALALEGIGWTEILNGQDTSARDSFEESLRLQSELGDPVLINRARVGLTQTLVALHQVDRARSLSAEILAFAEPNGDRRSEHFGWHFLADCALIEGKCEESLALYGKSLVLAHAMGDRLETSFEVQGVAMSLAGLGVAEQALCLAGAAKAEWERIGADIHMRFWDELLERYLGGARRALGADAADRAWAKGWAPTFEEAIALALEACNQRRSETADTVRFDRGTAE